MPTSDFNVSELAAYLHTTPQEILKQAKRDKIPGRKVAGEWIFSFTEIHEWLHEKIGVSTEEELRQVEGNMKRTLRPDEPVDFAFVDFLHPDAIDVCLPAKTRDSVIREMTKMAERTGLLWDTSKMADAIRDREELHPTALGNGVALLHPRGTLPNILGDSFVALGITSSGIPFGGSSSGTDVFFLLCSQDDRTHLRLLARVSRLLTTPGFLDALRDATDVQAVLELTSQIEGEMPHS
jgi:nitrogen PTS system EIIA component